MNAIIKRSIILTSIIISGMSGFGQSALPNIIPPSPEAMAFKKFGDYPVSHYTGLPTIQIPIYDINIDGVTIPISLNYHAGGNKVNESASWVGLGWTLNAGGVLSRVIKGIPDEEYMGYLSKNKGYNIYPSTFSDPTYYQAPNTLNNYELSYIIDVAQGSRDAESDEYSINFSDLNISFVFDTIGNPRCFPLSDLKIIQNHDASFIVKDTRGIVYHFEQTETIKQMRIDRETGISPSEQEAMIGRITGWYITKIITPNGQKIDFIYSGINSTMSISTSETLGKISNALINNYPQEEYHSYSQIRTTHQVPKLSKIVFPGGEVTFTSANESRQDIEGQANFLEYIEIKNNKDTIKKFKLSYSYFQSDNIYGSTESYLFKRLQLIKIQELIGTESIPPYIFSYYQDEKLPSLISHAQDHWGYYNGFTGNDHVMYKFIPDDSYIELYNDIDHQYQGANRTPQEAEMKAWILTQIDYPSGGKTTFEFEPHKYYENPESIWNEEFRNELKSYSNESVTKTNLILENTSCIHEFVAPGIENRAAQGTLTIYFANPTGGKKSHKVYVREKGNLNNVFFYNHEGDSVVISNLNVDLVSGTTYELVMESNLGMPDKIDLNIKYKVNIQLNHSGTEKIAGGLRIKRIKNYRRDGNYAEIKDYSYKLNDTVPSSAKLDHNFKYFLKYYGSVNTIPTQTTPYLSYHGVGEILQPAAEIISSYSLNGLGTTKGASVGYSRVEETSGYEIDGKTYYENGKTVWYYTTRENSTKYIYPDFMSGYFSFKILPPNPANPADGLPEHLWSVLKAKSAWIPAEIFPFIEERRKSWEEGLLTSKIQYNHSGEKVYSLINNYSLGVNHTQISEGLKVETLPYSLAYSNKYNSYGHISDNASYRRYFISTDRVRLNNTTEYMFYNNDSIKKTTFYKYNEAYLKKTSEVTITSKRDTLITHYEYPFDYIEDKFKNMTSNNFLPVIKYYTKNNNTIISGLQTNYAENNYSNELNRNIYLPQSINEYTPKGWETKIIFDNYNENGNLLQYHKKNDASTYYLWGYNSQYPVAKIESASSTLSIDQMQAAISNLSGSQDKTAIDADIANIRSAINSYGAADAMVTIYTYAPLVGMTSQTDTNGKTTYYEYDAFGRLKTIRDHQSNILNKYDYHYRQQ